MRDGNKSAWVANTAINVGNFVVAKCLKCGEYGVVSKYCMNCGRDMHSPQEQKKQEKYRKIKISCTEREKNFIINALTKFGGCILPMQCYGLDCPQCYEKNIEWDVEEGTDD